MILALGSLAYGAAIELRNAAYRTGVLRATRVTKPVISVGNLTAGGNGKTPFVILLAKILEARGRCVAVLSRGYRGRAEKTGEVVIVSRDSAFELCGDEPVLIAQKTGARVVVARDRRRAAQKAIEELGADVLLLDDGFQHRKLARDLDIVLVDAAQPFANGRLLPSGRLRERPSALARANLIAGVSLDGARSELASVHVRVVAKPRAPIEGKRVALFAAIARPERFEETVRALGATIVATSFFRDHAVVPPATLDQFERHAREEGAEQILTTEKDAVRVPGRFEALPIEHEIIAGRDVLDRAIDGALA